MPRTRRTRSRTPHPLAWQIGLVTWIIVLVASVVAGGGAGMLLGYLSAQTPIQELEYYSPPQVTQVLERRGRDVVAEFYSEKRQVLTLREMPSALPNAFIAIEDRRFREHFGADPLGILRAMVVNVRARSMLQGASTITQQMTRNVLPNVGKDRSIDRKIREALLALRIEKHYSKDQILEFYLNQVYLGNGTYGVQAAAQTYFGKNALDLTPAECAALAASVWKPGLVNPVVNPDRLLKRRNMVLEAMASLHFLEPGTLEAEQARPLATGVESPSRLQAPYFIDEHVRARLLRDPDFDDDILKRGGYRIFSTLDVACQTILEEELPRGLKRAEREWQKAKEARQERYLRNLEREGHTSAPREGQVRLARIRALFDDGLDVEIGGYRGTVAFPRTSKGERRVPYFDPDLALTVGHLIDVRIEAIDRGARRMELAWYDTKHLQGAAALLDVKTGHILALVGGADYYDMENAGMWNRATREGRQPGSSLKPLLYAIALDNGKTLGSIIMDDRIDYGGYVPRNYENRYFGPTTLYWALIESNNVVTIKLFKELGFKRAFRGYRAFDILEPRPTWKLLPELPTCLGSINATPLSIAAAYLPFARNGIGIEPLCVRRVEDLEGRRLKTMRPRERRVVSPQSAFLTTAMLREATRNAPGRTGRGVGEYFDALEMPVPQMAGKTGTTTNCVDAWFVGYTPDLVLAVWVGFDRVRSLGPRMTGSRVAAPIWCETMRRVLETRDDWRMAFEEPPGIVYRDISAKTGALASAQERRDGSTMFHRVPFRKGTEPNEPGEPYPGFPYWRYQHPDPEKNKVPGPNSIPSDLYLPWASRREAPQYSPNDTPALP